LIVDYLVEPLVVMWGTFVLFIGIRAMIVQLFLH
jgi:hypothetical protein